MTGVLLDTHALVWAATSPDRLGRSALVVLEDPTTTLWVSAASAWEMSTKVRTGLFPEAEPLVAQFDDIVDGLGAVHLPITSRDALRAGGLSWGHRDPFDRMLAAQAMHANAALVSRDRPFADLPGLDLLWD